LKKQLQIDAAEGKNQYPKVLIVGHSFNKTEGGGITLSNLFMGWPKQRIAVADNRYLFGHLDLSVCEKYYQLGYNGKLHPFPVNIFLPKIKCGPVNINPLESKKTSRKAPRSGKYKKIYAVLKAIMDFFGVYNFFYKIPLTDDFLKWVKEYDPDVIYSQLSTLELIRLVTELHKQTKKQVAIHIWDDWPAIINRSGLLYLYWKKTIDKEFRNLINYSSILMSISESMSREYKVRYGKEFHPFHNPISLEEWLPHTKKDWSRKGKFCILYAGRIGIGMEESIVEFAQCIHELSKEIPDLIFEIQSNDVSRIKNQVVFNNHVIWTKQIPYNQLPKKFSSADLLLMPVDFDERSLKFIKLSFQTKISEYMISGTPVIVYADKRTEVARYVNELGWGFLVSNRNSDNLKEAIKKLYGDQPLRRFLGSKAVMIACEKEDSIKVREEFRNYLSGN
jgi:glycosyltransferase involved in cell wall biosynthesis